MTTAEKWITDFYIDVDEPGDILAIWWHHVDNIIVALYNRTYCS